MATPEEISAGAVARVRLCHVQLLPLMSGVQRVTYELFRGLDRSRFELHLAVSADGPFCQAVRELGARVHIVDTLVRPISPAKDVRATAALCKLFRRERFDIVHTHSSKPGVVGRVAARLAGVPAVVHHVHGFAFHEYSPPTVKAVYSALEYAAARFCDAVIFVNEEERRRAARFDVVPDAKSVTVYNAADLERFNPQRSAQLRATSRAELGLEQEAKVVAFVGRLWEQKNPLALVPTLTEIDRIAPELRPHLVVAGEGRLESEVRRQADTAGLSGRVTFTGWVDDVSRVLAAADVLYLPSLWEGFPLTLTEATAAGVPCVASDIKGNREAVLHEQTGILVPPKDVPAAARAIVRLLTDDQLRERMSRRAAGRAREVHDTALVTAKVVAVYDKLLAASRRTHFSR